jgi:hypothetical protein
MMPVDHLEENEDEEAVGRECLVRCGREAARYERL